MTKWAVGIVIFILVIAGVIYGIYQKNDYDFNDTTVEYTILQTWEMPEELREISGIYWLGDERIACIQDEDGYIFIYDLKTSRIVDKYKFAGSGDYEAITSLNDEFWVVESNGTLFNIKDLKGIEEDAVEIKLDFEYRNNIEGLAASKQGNLWLIVKERNLDNRGDYRGIYAFDPETRNLDKTPVLKINFNDPAFDRLRTNNPRQLIRPSDMSFHPETNELYVLDAEFQKLLILKPSGKIKELHLLDPEKFTQPEGICFSPSGRMFISNEALGGPANIIELKFDKNQDF
ncbi:hypothetical protein GCM10023115_51690 [Pontixanthobacter gangjinensis]|uniref:SdiA-regulated superfamily protein n=1 Tax=Christiangramia aestuarii TaxID=1028746 RepID=A0A7K1LQL2_9FLAO|nr:SdiA-regulated domain-containing protein [Christiangramia aestuarii]MUP42750.1 SdiA-regulated superfamily protein [Christiangramia aestuarii]